MSGLSQVTGVTSDRVDSVNQPRGRIRYGWPLLRIEWDRLPTWVSDSSRWQSRPLGHASKGSVPNQAGVYLMCVRPPGFGRMSEPFRSLVEVIYVGRTKNLRSRYADHLNTPSAKVRAAIQTYSGSVRFWFLRTPIELTSTIETLLIDCFGPPANDKPGDAISVEIGVTNRA